MAKREEAAISVLMIGSPRVGKSSVLASMLRSLGRVYDETGVAFEPDGATELLMQDKLGNLEKIYSLYDREAEFATQSGMAGGEWYAAATQERISYRFALNVQTEQEKACRERVCSVEFTDIRGEDLTQRQDDVIRRIQESSVIIVAVDSVALMEYDEHGGSYNDLHNFPSQIHRIIEDAYTTVKAPRPQLLLLVPLKCEKYYWERGGMERLNRRVKQTYADLLTFARGNRLFSAAITPILTLGDVEFSRFESAKAYTPMYRFRTKDENGRVHTPAYSPRFCDQPLFYIAAYILTALGLMTPGEGASPGRRIGEDVPEWVTYYPLGFLAWLVFRMILRRLQKPEIRLKLAQLAGKIKLEGDGYEMVLDSLNMRTLIRQIGGQDDGNKDGE